jgi:hypothetical protein
MPAVSGIDWKVSCPAPVDFGPEETTVFSGKRREPYTNISNPIALSVRKNQGLQGLTGSKDWAMTVLIDHQEEIPAQPLHLIFCLYTKAFIMLDDYQSSI